MQTVSHFFKVKEIEVFMITDEIALKAFAAMLQSRAL
jgi:hypothetical protein